MNQSSAIRDPPLDLSACDLEPIHIPSLIQPHGMLLAARLGDLRIVYVSRNAELFLGLTPASILGNPLLDLLGPELLGSIDEALGEQQEVPRNLRAISLPACPEKRFDVTVHRSGGLQCVEFEFSSGEARWDRMASRLKGANRELSLPRSLRGLCAVVPPLVRRLTGYDRVIVYKFHADGHGEVVGDDKEAGMDSFLGLHYPVTDIPRQARELYLKQRFRMIVDVDSVPVPLLGHAEWVDDEPLDMTFCGLRSNSPVHLEYMRIMGVAASMGISLVSPSGKLWGLIVGHHRTGKNLPPEARALCDLLGQTISLLIGTAEQTDEEAVHRETKQLVGQLSESVERGGPDALGFVDDEQALLALVHADGAVVRLGGHLTLVGSTPAREEAAALFLAMNGKMRGETLSTDSVGTLLPVYAHLASQASGALMVPFQQPLDGILWLRAEVVHTVRWAGSPDAAKQDAETSVRLSPRKSFAVWEQVQHGRSLPWLPAEVEAALAVPRIAARAAHLRTEASLIRLHTDRLTGLGNRPRLLERLARWRARDPQAPAALLFLDLDNFKLINDRYGHQVGDEFLRRVGARLGFVENWKHLIVRLGGDEFAIFCEDTSLTQAEQLSTFLLEALAEPFEIMGKALSTTASIGIAPIQRVLDSSSSDPLRVADSAMYVAKHKGGNQFSIIESREQAEILRIAILEEDVARRLAAQELATAHARFESVLESTSDNVVTLSRDWTVLYVNHEAANRFSDFAVGDNYWDRCPAAVGTSAGQALRTAMREGTEQECEMFFATKARWFRARAFPVEEGISIFFRDFTEEKSSQEQLAVERLLRERRIESLTHMAAGLAHEISNPLAIIHGLALDLNELAQPPMQVEAEEVRAACANILKTANRASNILRGLRGFAREAAQAPMELGSIYELVDQYTELQQARLDRHAVELRIAMAPGIPSFLCREVQIGQILTNLLNNAFDAITQSDAAERWIELSVACDGTHLYLDVTDSAPGIEDHFKAHLMEPFFTTKELGLGIGVGLSLSRAIAQDHNGALTLLTDTEHTTFRLTLPLDPDAAAPIPDLAEAAA